MFFTDMKWPHGNDTYKYIHKCDFAGMILNNGNTVLLDHCESTYYNN